MMVHRFIGKKIRRISKGTLKSYAVLFRVIKSGIQGSYKGNCGKRFTGTLFKLMQVLNA